MAHASFSTEHPPLAMATGLAALAAAALLSTTIFPDLGPPAERLASDIPAIRRTAEITLLEIAALRVALALGGLSLLALWAFWPRLRETAPIRWLASRPALPLSAAHVSRRSGAILLGATLLFLAWVALGGRNPALFPPVIGLEDGPVEYATALLFVIAAGLAFAASRRGPGGRYALMHLALALGFLVCAGEEISWGQRLLDYSTPATLDALNAQGEFNLHNSFGYSADHIFMAGVALYGVMLPLLARTGPAIHGAADLTGLPIASAGLALGFAAASLIHDWSVFALLPRVPMNMAEGREFLCALGFLLLMTESLSRPVQPANSAVSRAASASSP
ncbi:hypothetical protein HMH01_08030 [Halovulum dunhuangense]|uniref:Uncharacterized protein n=1 Tax=Halovulum dunhuangense TaxID=1505036 RepID=A0A849L292_9RHOB|nr:hypothetical protein [Halovulum dunhuangense]NNU80389.1 hypothetical protein [Halovulum dunhuangense]